MVKGFTVLHRWRTINGEGVYHASLMEDNQ